MWWSIVGDIIDQVTSGRGGPLRIDNSPWGPFCCGGSISRALGLFNHMKYNMNQSINSHIVQQ